MSDFKTDPLTPPPIPPRPSTTAQQNALVSPSYGQRFGMGPFGSPYSFGGMGMGYGMGSMSPYQPYGSAYGLGGYSGLAPGGIYGGLGGNGINGNGIGEVEFIRIAEENSRRAFQSIESIVHAFSSVSMLMESTYFAVHTSFRAVLGVAEHMARLKQLMAGILSSLTIMKTLRRFLHRILQMFYLIEMDDTTELAWSESMDQSTLASHASMHQSLRGLWPIFMFLSVITGTPWLIWKLMSNTNNDNNLHNPQSSMPNGLDPSNNRWAQQEGDHYVAVVKYPFQTNQTNELPLLANEKIIVAPANMQPKIQGWLLASKMNGKEIGLVPGNYIEIETLKK